MESNPDIKIHPLEVHDAVGKEIIGSKFLTVDGVKQSGLDLNVLDDEVNIRNIVTRESSKRSGYARLLVDDLFNEFPDKKITISNMTDDGSKFIRSQYQVNDETGEITPKNMANSGRNNMNINEGLEYQDLKKMLKPSVHIDEFASKMGDDDKISVISFMVKSRAAADDLVNWFESGYEFVLDADRSPGEIKPNRYIVYVEMRRRTTLPEKIEELLDDLQTLTEFKPDDWIVSYGKQEMPFSKEAIESMVPLSPKEYRDKTETETNRVREAAGLKPISIYDSEDEELLSIQEKAGII